MWKGNLRPRNHQGRQWRYGDKNCNQTSIWLILPHCLFITWNCFYWLLQGDCFLEHLKGPSWYLIVIFRPLFRDCVMKISQSLHGYNPNGFNSCVIHLSKCNSPGVIENNVLVLNYNKMEVSFLLAEVWGPSNSYQTYLWMWNNLWDYLSVTSIINHRIKLTLHFGDTEKGNGIHTKIVFIYTVVYVSYVLHT